MGVYVDDLIITRGDVEVLGRFKKEMSKNIEISDLGVLYYYLDIEVPQNSTGISICQSAYAKKLLDTTGLVDSNPTRTPMEARLQLRKANTTTTVDSTNYRSIVESSSRASPLFNCMVQIILRLPGCLMLASITVGLRSVITKHFASGIG
ncbi:uncharacterized protein LOC111785458, partial [Cucurbita pepo subsp. pepo]|uniref:uncharacterized protein LOC111785458 n=1 Tax=Cucurbita pepo subsp. pepo TaxID=3664 RepID=UPI000C9D684B